LPRRRRRRHHQELLFQEKSASMHKRKLIQVKQSQDEAEKNHKCALLGNVSTQKEDSESSLNVLSLTSTHKKKAIKRDAAGDRMMNQVLLRRRRNYLRSTNDIWNIGLTIK
jgi:hypothetical protein